MSELVQPVSRRTAIKAAAAGIGVALAAEVMPASAKDSLVSHEVLNDGTNAWYMPYLPLREEDSIAFAQEKGDFGLLATARVFIPDQMNAAVDPNNRYASRAEAANAYAREKGWVGPDDGYVAFEQVFSYPSTMLADEATLRAGEDVTVWYNGDQVPADSIQLSSYTVAVAPVKLDRMVAFANPGETGQIRARLIAEENEGQVAFAFAKNRNVDTLSAADDSGEGVPAIHIDGYPNAPVRLTYYFPTEATLADKNGKTSETSEQVVIEKRLSDAGDLAVHLLRSDSLYQGDFAPVVLVQVYTQGSGPNPETEVEFRIGTDDNSKGKNRVTQKDVLDAR
ncbi:MAG: hypothetical protein Q8Q49_03745 [bacterium]|nr:hypothetical protein [bacterium]